MHKQDFALNNQQGLICHKTQPKTISVCLFVYLSIYMQCKK